MAELLSDDELATLSDRGLVDLILERTVGLDRTGAREALMIIRDEIPDGVTL